MDEKRQEKKGGSESAFALFIVLVPETGSTSRKEGRRRPRGLFGMSGVGSSGHAWHEHAKGAEGKNIQLPAIGAINVAGNRHAELAGGRLNVIGQRRIVRRPVDKVDQVDAEVGGVGIDGGPLQVKGLTLVKGGIGDGISELQGRDKRRREGSESKHTHLE